MNIYYIAGMITSWLLVLILIAILGIGCYFLWVELIERILKDRKLFKEVLIKYMIEKNKKSDKKESFKVGDRVKIKKTSEICIVVSKNDIYEPEYETETVNLLNIETERYLGFFNEDDLELDDSLEQLAVKKFKEKFKSKLLKAINENNQRTGYSDLVDQDIKTKNGLLKEVIRVLEIDNK